MTHTNNTEDKKDDTTKELETGAEMGAADAEKAAADSDDDKKSA